MKRAFLIAVASLTLTGVAVACTPKDEPPVCIEQCETPSPSDSPTPTVTPEPTPEVTPTPEATPTPTPEVKGEPNRVAPFQTMPETLPAVGGSAKLK